MKRNNINPKVLAAERAAITQFLFDRVVPYKGAKLPLAAVFAVYKKWRKENKMPATSLCIDGFGRMFPKAYPRKSAHWPPVKHALKCVFGIVVKA